MPTSLSGWATRFAPLALLLVPELSATAQSLPDPVAVLEASAKKYDSSGVVCADFKQRMEQPLIQREREAAGRLCQAPPNLFSMRFSDPEGDLIVADGSYVWMYNPSVDSGQVLRREIAAGAAGVPMDFRREFLEDPGSKYIIEELGQEWAVDERAHMFSLTPRQAGSYERAELWVGSESHLIRRLVLHQNESIRTIDFSSIELNPDIPEGTFSFTPPPGTQVITR